LKHKQDIYYTQERENYYQSIIEARVVSKRKKDNQQVIDDRKEKALKDFQYFVSTYFRHYIINKKGIEIKLAPFHTELVQKIFDNDQIEILAELPRGHAKSTVFGIFLPIWLIINKKIHNMVSVGPTADAASIQLIHLQTEFETNDLLIDDFGPFRKQGNWSKGNFIIPKYDVKCSAIGKGQSPRGFRYKNYRIDFCVVDDIDTDKECRNPKIIKEQWDWVLQSLFNALEITEYRFIWVGNRYAHNMLLDKMSKMEDIEHVVIKAIENEKPVWENRFTLKDLDRVRKKIGKINFLREYMNTPISVGSVFKEEEIIFNETLPFIQYDYIITYVDPSWKPTGDYKSCITLGFKDRKYHVIDVFLKKTTIKKVIEYLYELNDILVGSAFRMYFEANFNQDLHKLEFDKEEIIYGYSLPITYDKSKKPNKFARIESMSVIFENNEITFNNKIKNSPDMNELQIQLLGFMPGSKLHDDGPDALQSAKVKLDSHVRKTKFKPMTGQRERTNHY